jgi:hypothetical protein
MLMKTHLKSTMLAISLLVALIAPVALARLEIKTKRSEFECLSIFASDHQALITTGCTSPVGFCAGGTFNGNHGFKGTSSFIAKAFHPIPDDDKGRQVVPGESTYTTADGSITISDVSAFDSERGTFSGIGRIESGTGRFAGATGDVFTAGRALPDGNFINEFKAEICIPR